MTMVNTKFYMLADEAIAAECARIEAFTAELDKNPTEKKAQIAGGLILIGLGVKILLEHLGIILV